jgi:hypothetical protein
LIAIIAPIFTGLVFGVPVIGAVNATVGSTSLGYQDIIDIIDDGDDFYTKPDFMNRLKDNNKLFHVRQWRHGVFW